MFPPLRANYSEDQRKMSLHRGGMLQAAAFSDAIFWRSSAGLIESDKEEEDEEQAHEALSDLSDDNSDFGSDDGESEGEDDGMGTPDGRTV